MAQPNANREPTMEEILASIRRIIESNDTAGERQPIMAMAEEDGEALEDDIAPPVQSAQIYAPRKTMAPASAGESARPATRPVSLADVAARVRASGAAAGTSTPLPASMLRTEGNAAVRIEPDMDIAELPSEEEASEEAGDIRADNDAGQAFAEAHGRPEETEANSASEEEAFDSDICEAVTAAMATDGEAEKPEELQAAAVTGSEETGRQLVSSATGAKVAAAFEDLSEAFKAEQRRSFDEMAEEMLRPMLQQWLDDNLPTLVERLVREEIERVARGNRR